LARGANSKALEFGLYNMQYTHLFQPETKKKKGEKKKFMGVNSIY
jgi:hypothetical protein